jgi:predicted transglutaminase-like cysteine proteinase
MKRFWGSFICVLLYCSDANAGAVLNMWSSHYDPLPVAQGEYVPPTWLNDCVVAVAGDNVTTVSNCLPATTPGNEETEFVFDLARQIELETINEEVNSKLPEDAITLQESIDAAVSKRQMAIDLGFPAKWLGYGIVEAPMAAGENDMEIVDHIVLIFILNTRAFVLDSLLPEILPWSYSPHSFIGAQVEGVWYPVADDRDDPLAFALELYE